MKCGWWQRRQTLNHTNSPPDDKRCNSFGRMWWNNTNIVFIFIFHIIYFHACNVHQSVHRLISQSCSFCFHTHSGWYALSAGWQLSVHVYTARVPQSRLSPNSSTSRWFNSCGRICQEEYETNLNIFVWYRFCIFLFTHMNTISTLTFLCRWCQKPQL